MALGSLTCIHKLWYYQGYSIWDYYDTLFGYRKRQYYMFYSLNLKAVQTIWWPSETRVPRMCLFTNPWIANNSIVLFLVTVQESPLLLFMVTARYLSLSLQHRALGLSEMHGTRTACSIRENLWWDEGWLWTWMVYGRNVSWSHIYNELSVCIGTIWKVRRSRIV